MLEISENIRLQLMQNSSGRMEFGQFRKNHFRMQHVEAVAMHNHLIATNGEIFEAHGLICMAHKIRIGEYFLAIIGILQHLLDAGENVLVHFHLFFVDSHLSKVFDGWRTVRQSQFNNNASRLQFLCRENETIQLKKKIPSLLVHNFNAASLTSSSSSRPSENAAVMRKMQLA